MSTLASLSSDMMEFFNRNVYLWMNPPIKFFHVKPRTFLMSCSYKNYTPMSVNEFNKEVQPLKETFGNNINIYRLDAFCFLSKISFKRKQDIILFMCQKSNIMTLSEIQEICKKMKKEKEHVIL